MKLSFFVCFLIGMLMDIPGAWSQQNKTGHVSSPAGPDDMLPASWRKTGHIKTRAARDILSSRWSVGGETLDRDYADYKSYREYLGPLGAKRIRLQAGWAKTEKNKGVYDWAWLDSVVNNAVSQGVKPWIETSYGNPIYEGGGDARIGGGIPITPLALAAWDRWVSAMVSRYKHKVNEWEIWNEPNLSGKYTAEAYAAFFIRTASVIRREQPGAGIIALALGGISAKSLEFTRTFLSFLSVRNKLPLADIISFHIYPSRPENASGEFKRLKAVVDEFSKTIVFWQGETGCPSTPSAYSSGALSNLDWTETSQAKWILRRMFDEMKHADDIAVTSIFQISDMNSYNGGKNNTKGLLKTNPDKSIAYAKPSYYAMQHVTAVFDSTVRPVSDFQPEMDGAGTAEAVCFRRLKNGAPAFAVWLDGQIPSSSTSAHKVTIKLGAAKLKKPLYVDMLSGAIYRIPSANIRKDGGVYTLSNIPVYDAPVLIADEGFLIR
ncbi:GH39 family glycosyl hydrolase [Compostibacter hankyongensis]|uniref:Glycosyl hydrolases family 39 N-terminal catalytic domain-containing protein n=1 Tax=Compostibacter hankyongensis TaxID=1007089 RepID=A0ABP8FFA9_9BACT